MRNRLKSLETKVNDVSTSCSFISSEFYKQKSKVKSAKDHNQQLHSSCRNLEIKSETLEKQKADMATRIVDLEALSMLENLIFYGIPEQTDTNIHEDCENLVKELITTKMGLDGSSMTIDRAHRFGSNRAKKPRPIVVKFHYQSEREQVRQKSYDKDVKR